jgi:hydrogenase maturation protein HypF
LTDPIKEQLLATGGEIKSAFAYSHHQKVFVSQFLGDQSILESQEAYQNTLSHFEQMLKLKPSKILIDLHPNYVVAEIGAKKARESKIQSISVQHHKAHFASVLFENELMINEKPVLGIIWDGTGFGEDNHIWGSEVFIWNNHLMSRVAHLQYFPVLLADKMSKEPRLSALSLLKKIQADHILQNQFSAEEWHYYKQLLQKPSEIQTCSMGRFLDGICAILGIKSKSNYEAEPEMLLESLARTASHNEYYNFEIVDSFILWEAVLIELIIDIDKRLDITFIARKVINSLARVIKKISEINNIKQVAFSGGVFQNALLIDTIIELMGNTHSLYFQKELSPNDEGIALGQMAYYIHTQNSFII